MKAYERVDVEIQAF